MNKAISGYYVCCCAYRVEAGIAEQEVLRNTHEILVLLDLLNNQRYLTAKLCSRVRVCV